MTKQHAISPTREEDYPEWYQQVIKAADLAENSPVRGCMVIKPWGYAIWENIQKKLDKRIKDLGHENAYFPLFIPLSYLQKEADHVEGFAKECAVVTHHRLEERGGKLVPSGELDEPLIIRPTSETIIGESYSRWVESWRDLPLLINQWANVVRWEMRPRIFLRTAEFLWQEGHTAHATSQEAIDEVLTILKMYKEFMENVLATPVIAGEKSAGERFPGAEATYTCETMMQDRKALQAGTSHYMGQNFAKAANIAFSNPQGQLEYAYTTSWGCTTRMIGGVIMTHGDDDGLRLPPKIAGKQVVILPVIPNEEVRSSVLAYAQELSDRLSEISYDGEPLRVYIDKRDRRGGEKNWEWIKKGVPLRIEIGPRDMESGSAMVARRDKPHKEKESISAHELPYAVEKILKEMQEGYFSRAKRYLTENIHESISTYKELKEFFTPKNPERPEIHGGFVRAKWCEDPATETLLADEKLSIRCLPLEQTGTEGRCILTGKPAVKDVIIAKSY